MIDAHKEALDVIEANQYAPTNVNTMEKIPAFGADDLLRDCRISRRRFRKSILLSTGERSIQMGKSQFIPEVPKRFSALSQHS